MESVTASDLTQPALARVRPRCLNLVFGPPGSTLEERIELKRSLLAEREPIRGGDWDLPAERRFTDLEVYQAIEARISNGTAWEETNFYRRVLNDFARGTSKWGCANEEEFVARLAAVDELHRTIAREGFRSQAELGSNGADDVRVAIARDGRVLFVDGRHRLAIARALGIEEIPVRIVARHNAWCEFKRTVLDYARTHNGRVYQEIDHPDLRHVEFSHGPERIEMIGPALSPYAGRGLSLLDIGAHWGYMCQQLERMGFACHGVEMNRQSAETANKIATATESAFSVSRESIFDCPDVERFDVVLALNIFHHFLKTEEQHERLEALLRRVNAQVMIFEAHRHDPPAQMRDAYRNYPAEEFVSFVCRHAGFAGADEIGTARGGRRLFKLWR